MIFDSVEYPYSKKIAKNKLILAPLTNNQSFEDGTLGDDELHWLEACADGGFGTIISCAAMVDKTGRSWPGQFSVASDDMLSGMQRLAASLKKRKCCICRTTSPWWDKSRRAIVWWSGLRS